MKISDFVSADKFCSFLYYRHQHLYYSVSGPDGNYMFPIPLDDLADASVKCKEKSVLLMRYIRKSLADGSLVKISENNPFIDL